MTVLSITTALTGNPQAAFPDGIKVLGTANAVACTGSDQGSAAALSYGLNVISGADATKGVILPAPQAGAWVMTYSSAATNALPVYPSTGCTIDDGSSNASVSTAARKGMLFVATSATNWLLIKSA